MKIISVHFDDWDQPLIGLIAANDGEAEAIAERIKAVDKDEDYIVEVRNPDTEEDVVKYIKEIQGDDEENP